MGVAVRSSHLVFSAPSSSLSSPVPAWGPSHRRQSSTNFSNIDPSHGPQLFMNCSNMVPSTGCSPSGADCSSVGPLCSHKSCQQTCSSVGSSLHGSTCPGRSLLEHGLSTGPQPPLGIYLLQHGVLHGLQVHICSLLDLHGLQGYSLPHRGLHHRLQGNLYSGAWSTFSPSSFTGLGVCRVLSYIFSLLSPAAAFFPPF